MDKIGLDKIRSQDEIKRKMKLIHMCCLMFLTPKFGEMIIPPTLMICLKRKGGPDLPEGHRFFRGYQLVDIAEVKSSAATTQTLMKPGWLLVDFFGSRNGMKTIGTKKEHARNSMKIHLVAISLFFFQNVDFGSRIPPERVDSICLFLFSVE